MPDAVKYQCELAAFVVAFDDADGQPLSYDSCEVTETDVPADAEVSFEAPTVTATTSPTRAGRRSG